MQEFFKTVNAKYNQLLLEIDHETLVHALDLLSIKRKLLTDNTHIEDGFLRSELEKKAKPVFDLMGEYKKELKKVFLENDGLLVHITDIAPEKLVDGRILRSRDKLNNYMTEIGDWVFASSSVADGNNAYAARKSKDGMISINYTTMVYGGDNFEVEKDENDPSKTRVRLKEPNYIYYLNPEKFEPVCTVIFDRRSKVIRFDYSEEWVYGDDIDIANKTMVKKIEKVEDITPLFEWRQIFCDPNIHVERTPVAYRIRNTLPEKRLELVAQLVKEGRLKYINGIARINVNEELANLVGLENLEERE